MSIPSGIVTTAWPQVAAKGRELGIGFDWWQDALGRVCLGKRVDGKYAATVGGIVLSIPRQVGKTYFVGALVVILCVLIPGLKVIWTAHRTRTATNTFRSLQNMAKRKKVEPHVENIRVANGEQEISFRNGSLIMFGAREQGFGRGFDELDIEVFDEAQILTEKALEDIVPAANQSRQESGALLFFMGTPPRPSDPGEEFTNRRTKALDGKADNMVYVEFSADDDADPDDREQWAKANPSFPERTPVQSIERMRENLTDDASFKREGLGIWDAASSHSVIDAVTWAAVADGLSVAADKIALAIDVSPDNKRASVSLAGQRSDGSWHIELDEQRESVGWVVPWIVKRCERNDIRAVVIDGAGPAADLVQPLAEEKIKATVTTARDMAQACSTFYRGAAEGWMHHTDQRQMNVALGDATKRPLGDAWAWSRKNSASDITPIVSATLALWGARSPTVKKPSRSGNGRRAAMVL